MGNSEARTTVIHYILLLAGAVQPTSTTMTLTAYDGTGIVYQQPLTLGCNYTKGDSDVIIGFKWKRDTGRQNDLILSGSVTNQNATFQDGTGWESGVFLGDYTSSLTIQLPVSNVAPSVAGQYTCSVELIAGPLQDTATATVHYAPEMRRNFPSSRAVTEFSRFQINCSSYTTPGNPPTTSYAWTHGRSTVISGAVLDIHNISRDRRGQYTCTASNTVGSDLETVSVDVQYAPQIESTFPSSKSVKEFSRLQINCSSYTTPGNPPITSYTWTNGGSTDISEAVLDINNIGRDKSGMYTCKASNTVGSENANVSVNVHFLDRPELLVNKTEVVENETVSLTCNVESNPTAQLAIRNVDNKTVLVVKDTNRLQFTIYRVQCLHNGSFLCTAGNPQIGNASSSRFKEIDVKCSPRQDFRQKLDSTVVKQINDTAALVADVIANPVPEFRWFRQESGGLTNISRDTIHSISNSRLQSVLYINISRTQDYGDYVLEMENSQGRKQLFFTLTSKVSTALTVTAYDGTGIVQRQPLTLGCNYTGDGYNNIYELKWKHEGVVILSGSVTDQIARFQPGTGWESGVWLGDFTSSLTIQLPVFSVTPSVAGQYTCIVSSLNASVQDTATATVISLPKPPNEVTVGNITSNSLTISWRSNDNGGASQTFNIEFRIMKGEWRLWSEGIVDPGEGKIQKSEIRSLQSDTHYEVLVFARNRYGQSAKVVREVTTYDTAPCSSHQTPDRLGLGVGIGISVIIPVIIVILSLWCLSKRRESKNQKGENIDSNELPLQQNSATGDQHSYNDLTMTESTVNEYEQLQVPPGQSKVYQNV